jgi:hypothetical protein
MKVVVIARVKNERDIIEAFVRHHLFHVDQLLVLDDASIDGTWDVLLGLQQEGLPLVVLREASFCFDQHRFTTRLMHLAIEEHGADWVVPLDADEFVETEGGRPLREALAAREPALISVAWHNFVWQPGIDDSLDRNPVTRLRFRMPPRKELFKVMVPRRLGAARGATLAQGSHELLQDKAALPARPVDEIRLCHFPIRSLQQHAAKVATAYLKFAALPGWDGNQGFHNIAPFEQLRRGGLAQLAASMTERSRRYGLPDSAQVPEEPQELPLDYRGGPGCGAPEGDRFLPHLLDCAQALAATASGLGAESEAVLSALGPIAPAGAGAGQRVASLVARMEQAQREAAQADAARARAEAARAQADTARAQLESQLRDRDGELGRLRKAIAAQADQLSSRSVKLLQRVHAAVGRTGVSPKAIADRLYRFIK